MSPQVSVVTPVFNRARFIGEAIRSVLEQSFQDFEIVVTDDGSRDGTPDIIQKFSDPRIKLELFAQNRGAYVAQNDAIRRSTGEFVAILDSDDLFLPGKLATQVEFLRTNPRIAAVFGLPRIIDANGSRYGSGHGLFTIPFKQQNPTRKHWLRHFFFRGNCLCHSSAMIRKSVFDEIGLYNPRHRILADLEMWIRLCMVHEIHVMKDEVTAYRIKHDDNSISAPRRDTELRLHFEYFEILRHYLRMPPALAREVFADDLAAKGIDPNGNFHLWLSELAVDTTGPVRQLFGLDTMFNALSPDEENYHRLLDLAGTHDVFGLFVGKNAEQPAQPAAFGGHGQTGKPAPRQKLGRNDPCPCGSGKKYKHCHGRPA